MPPPPSSWHSLEFTFGTDNRKALLFSHFSQFSPESEVAHSSNDSNSSRFAGRKQEQGGASEKEVVPVDFRKAHLPFQADDLPDERRLCSCHQGHCLWQGNSALFRHPLRLPSAFNSSIS